jgi:XTP/dITP diphosphohydrolase
MTTLLLATRNAHKVGEIRSMLGERFQFLTLRDFPDAPEVIEDADTFAGNATKKATELATWLAHQPLRITHHASRLAVLADDSGLEVDALDGQPGVLSARFAAQDTGMAGNSADAANNAKLLRLLAGVPAENRTARFRCVLALVEVHPPSSILHPQIFDGACEGRIDFAPRGANGFGYDPLFIPHGHPSSFAELGETVKNQLSHRAQALKKLRVALGV